MIHQLSKKTTHIIGVITVFIFIVYLNFNCTCNTTVNREGLSEQDSVTVNKHKIQLDNIKNTICLKKNYDEKVQQIKELESKLKQMKNVNSANDSQNSANAGVTG